MLQEIDRIVLMCVLVGYVVQCPYSKVEESFNTQAVHDFWRLGISNKEGFDHLEFSGTVPRTFIGAFIIGYLGRFIETILTFFGMRKAIFAVLARGSIARQIVARLLLTVFWLFGFERLVQSVQRQYGLRCGSWLRLLTACQFHVPFYASRFLPNTIALVPCLYAYGLAFDGYQTQALALIAATTAILRCDLLTLLVPLGICWTLRENNVLLLFSKRILACVFAIIMALVLTIPLDSTLWQYLVWPEATVLLYNNPVENKSANWGTSPRHWYWCSALPRALNPSTMLLTLFGAFFYEPNRLGYSFILPAFLSIFLLSFLPHKELRFIFPTLPLLTTAAAVAATRLDNKVQGSLSKKKFIPYITLAITASATIILFYPAAQLNYPGGVALFQVHELFRQYRNEVKILHIDVAAATTGASRFGQQFSSWTYDKTENIDDPSLYFSYDFRIAPIEPRDQADLLSRYNLTIVDTIHGYDGIHLDLFSLRSQLKESPLYFFRFIFSLFFSNHSQSLFQHKTKPELVILAKENFSWR
mmetsp:Transcript_8652/g.13307  ORF Transcript_8652/g.13307 Transcript_8652/m.13307 type:complete len:531 (-) Transcript_8652:61-1653(-)